MLICAPLLERLAHTDQLIERLERLAAAGRWARFACPTNCWRAEEVESGDAGIRSVGLTALGP